MAQGYVGIDVSKDTLDCHLMHGGRRQYREVGNTKDGFRRIHKWLKKQCGRERPHVCLEATGQYSDGVAEHLYDLHYPVSVVNPTQPKRFAQSMMRRNKTDKADAQVLALFCQATSPALWAPPPAHVQELRATTRRLDSLKEMRQQERNRLGAGELPDLVIESIVVHLELLNEQIAVLDHAAQEQISQHEDLREKRKLLVSIPGIGNLTAAKLIAEIPWNIEFESARQLAAYAGVTPSNHESGSSVHRRAYISKKGNVHLRKSLYMPALVAKTHNPLIAAFYERRIENGLSNKAAIVACMRKMLHIVYGVLEHGKPFDPNYGSE